MGCAPSTSKADDEKNKEINKYLADEKRQLENEVKLLLLGAGESGKSTVAKQMKIIHKDGFNKEERLSYRAIIHSNTFLSMRALCQACADLELTVSPDHAAAFNRIMEDDDFMLGSEFTQQLADDIKLLWTDEAIKTAFSRSAEFQLNDSARYYFDKIDVISAPDFIPDEQDVLRSRAKTTGIIEIEFDAGQTHFKMVDVGGQKSERKKWMHCFQDVTAVIFCVAMSEYNLKMYEDDRTNRMHDSLKLFRDICNNKWFVNTAMILFLNKKDIFEDKIMHSDLTVCFPEYPGESKDAAAAAKYIEDQFLAQNENPRKPIYAHTTCATDTDNIQKVFGYVKDIILRAAIDDNFGL